MKTGTQYITALLRKEKMSLLGDYERIVHLKKTGPPGPSDISALQIIQIRMNDLDNAIEILNII